MTHFRKVFCCVNNILPFEYSFSMHILNTVQTAAVLPYAELVSALMLAASQLQEQKIQAPERLVVPIDKTSVLLCMPAISTDIGITKLVTVHAHNAHHQLPAIQGEVVVFDVATGVRLVLLDGPTVTARRTAAVTLLGIETLLPIKPKSVLLIGTGVQAATHAEALIEYFGVLELWIAARNVGKAQIFCHALQQRHPQVVVQPLTIAALEKNVPHTDVVIALTTSKIPVIPVDIAATTLAIGVGAFTPEMAEFPAQLLHRRTVVVDCLTGAQQEAGDLLQANIDWSKVCELPQVLAQGWRAKGSVPVYKTVGQAAWDLAAARVALAMWAKYAMQ